MTEKQVPKSESENNPELEALRSEQNRLIDLSEAAKPGEQFQYAKQIEALDIEIFKLKSVEENIVDLENHLAGYSDEDIEEITMMFGGEGITRGYIIESAWKIDPEKTHLSSDLVAEMDTILAEYPWIVDDNEQESE